jgi:hypothetical protein
VDSGAYRASAMVRGVAGAVLLLGGAVLLGWALGIPALTSVLPGLTLMKANTAACFLLAGIALELAPWTRPYTVLAARSCALLVFATGFLTWLQHMTGLDFAIDDLLFAHSDQGAAHPGRMAMATSVAFVATGIALFALPRGARAVFRHVASIASIVVAAIGTLGLVGYGIDADILYSWDVFGTVALHTAAGFALLGTAMWLAAKQWAVEAEDTAIARRAWFSSPRRRSASQAWRSLRSRASSYSSKGSRRPCMPAVIISVLLSICV